MIEKDRRNVDGCDCVKGYALSIGMFVGLVFILLLFDVVGLY